MSGEKRVSITVYEDDFERMMQATRRVENLEARDEHLREQSRITSQQLDHAIEEGKSRQKAFDQTVDSLSSELQVSTREFSCKLHRQQDQFEQGFDNLDQRMQEQRAELKSDIADLDHRMQEQRTELKFDIAGITTQIARKYANAKTHAEHWLADAEKILTHIEKNYRHEKFMLGGLSLLRGKQKLAQSNMQDGVYEAAISKGQEVFSDALALQADLEMLEQEWNGYFTMADEGARKLLAECTAEQSSKFSIEMTAGVKELDAEIDYWTDGALSQLISHTKQQLTELKGQREQLGLPQLKQIIADSNELRQQFEAIVEQARQTLIASQLRFNMAEDVVQALEGAGWSVKDSAWQGEGQDGRGWKGSFHIKLKSLADDEMVTVIMPNEARAGTIENDLQFSYYPADCNDSTFAEIQTCNIQKMLHEKELISSPAMQCVPGQEKIHRGRPERLDFDQVRQDVATVPQQQRGI